MLVGVSKGAEMARIVRRRRWMIGHLIRPMRRVVGDVEKERLLTVLRDQPDGAIGNEVGQVTRGCRRLVILEQIGLTNTVAVLVKVHEAALETEEVLEAVCARAKGRQEAEMPLPNQRGAITVVLQQLRERVARSRKPEAAVR